MEGLHKSDRLLHRVVVVIEGVLQVHLLDDDVQPSLLGARVIPEPRLLDLPGVDSLPEHAVRDVHVAVDHDALFVQGCGRGLLRDERLAEGGKRQTDPGRERKHAPEHGTRGHHTPPLRGEAAGATFRNAVTRLAGDDSERTLPRSIDT